MLNRTILTLAVMLLFGGALTAQSNLKLTYNDVVITNGGTVQIDLTEGTTHICAGFFIRNTGSSVLTMPTNSAVSLGAKQNCTATMETQPADTLNPNSYTTFGVRARSTTPGTYQYDVSISSNDPDDNPFNFTVMGTVKPASAAGGVGTAVKGGGGGGGGCVSVGGGSVSLLVLALLAELAFLARIGFFKRHHN